jgi:hypothetical protein
MMAKPNSGNSIELLLRILDQGFHRKSWHGPNLRGSIRGLSPEQTVWRPQPRRHSIAEQVLHTAYWKYTVRRRLLGQKRGSFPLKGSNWFLVPGPLTESAWREQVALLEEQHGLLRDAVAGLALNRLDTRPGGGSTSVITLVTGIAAHDVYHAGQIQLLKAMYHGMD